MLGGILLALSVGLLSPVFAQAAGDDLSTYEQKLFTHSYMDEPLSKRLERLEQTIFGEAQTGSEAQRKSRLLTTLGAAQKIIPEAREAPAANPENDENTADGDQPPPVQPPRQPDATDYPTVTALEREVFSRDFIHDDVSNRLGRLEKKTFGHSYPELAMVDRVDKLLARYPNARANAVGSSEDGVSPALRDLPSDSRAFSGTGRDTYTKMDAMERAVYGGQSFPSKLLTERLDNLESQVLGHSYTGESVDTRVNRLMKSFDSANAASTNSGYQTPPRFQPRPGFETPQGAYMPSQTYSSDTSSGGYTASGSGSVYIPGADPPPPARQNIQIGAGMSSSSTYHFSNDMLNMLPPDVRNQLSGQGGSQTVITSPPGGGTVTIEQSTTSSYPGFQTYGGAPMQYYNYYGAPGGTTQSHTSTTVIQPNGGQTVYQYEAVPQGYANPAYVGDPQFLQQLGNLEMNAYGHVNTVEPVYVRLSKLESSILGQIYPDYPEPDRLANLQKAWKYQSIGSLLGKGKAGDVGRAAGSMILGVPLAPTQPGVPTTTMPGGPAIKSN